MKDWRGVKIYEDISLTGEKQAIFHKRFLERLNEFIPRRLWEKYANGNGDIIFINSTSDHPDEFNVWCSKGPGQDPFCTTWTLDELEQDIKEESK
ncbi:hypothetical protein [uncultured Duncaniella sp.]|uniref:hypothetical protein n=1 Tax=uncultured Duncaniella sp. TaxID=2768039 RepID=UPI0026033E31|nr:hypothetical protein [uncultured Duncaniella sp.]